MDETNKHSSVFYISIVIAALFVAWGIILPQNLASSANAALKFITAKFGWFVLGVMLVPTLLSAFWFSTMGGSALSFQMFGHENIGQAVTKDVTSALFITLQQFPLGHVISILATILICTFFVTSADSATFVLGMLTSRGALNPPLTTKIIWGVLQSSIAAVLLLSGGLKGLQTASIVAALPFAVVMILMMVSLNKALREEEHTLHEHEKIRRKKLDKLLHDNPD